MKHHPPTPRRALAGALACALAAAACTDQPSGPSTLARTGGASMNAGAQPQLVSNAIRYRDTGQKPGTGRSGIASLSVLALLDGAGITHLNVVSGTTTQPGTGAGTLGNVQLKVFVSDSADDALVTNFRQVGSGTFNYQVMGPVRGTPLQVQAGVGGLDGARTDVVTVRDSVVLAPDLRVTHIGPDRVRVGMPANVAAFIDERNGDVGARADCVLYVDGAAEDRANGIWVDARDGVYCMFNHIFTTPGARAVEIRLENVSPMDYDPSNNAETHTYWVEDAGSFSYSASAYDTRGSQSYYNRRRWTEPSGYTAEDLRDYTVTYADQYASIQGWRAVGLALPVTARLGQTSGGTTFHAATLSGLGAGHAGGQFCHDSWDGTAGVTFFFCTSGSAEGGYTSFQYQRVSNAISYHSLDFSGRWDPAGTPTYVYSENFSFQSGTTHPQYGGTFDFLVEFTDAAGQVYPTDPTVVMGESAWDFVNPRQCLVVDDWYYDFLENCWGGEDHYLRRGGFANFWY